MRKTLLALLALTLLALPASAQYAPQKIGGNTTAGALQTFPLADGDTGAGTSWLAPGLLAIPGAGGYQLVDAAHPLPTVDAGNLALLVSIDAYLAAIDGHVPQLSLGAQAPAAALSVTQDSAGAWTVVEASGATIAGDTTSLDGHIPQLTIGAQAMAASLSVTVATDQGAIPTTPALSSAAAQAQIPLIDADNAVGTTIDRLGVVIVLPGDGTTKMVGAGAEGTALPIGDDDGSLTVDSPQLPAALVGGAMEVGLSDGLGTPLTSTAIGGKQGLDIADGGDSLTVDGTVALGAGAATIGKVDIELAGVAADTDQGIAGTGTQRVKEAQPADSEDSKLAVDQSAPDTYVIPADAYETTCQNQSATDYINVRAVDAAEATLGYRLAPETGGAGQPYTTHLRGVTLYFFNVTQDVPAVVYCASDTEP